MNQQIKKQIELNIPLSNVWLALTDYQKFGEWFLVKLTDPFTQGGLSIGHMTYPGYEHIKWEAVIQKIDHEHLFSFTWHPYAVDDKMNYLNEEPTLVEFKLEKIANGTRLTLIESGFEKLPAKRRSEALLMNEKGWEGQMKNIERYLDSL